MNTTLINLLRASALIASAASVASASTAAVALLGYALGWGLVILTEGFILACWYYLGVRSYPKGGNHLPAVFVGVIALVLSTVLVIGIHSGVELTTRLGGSPDSPAAIDYASKEAARIASSVEATAYQKNLMAQLKTLSATKTPEAFTALTKQLDTQQKLVVQLSTPLPPPPSADSPIPASLSWAVAAAFPILSAFFMVLAAAFDSVSRESRTDSRVNSTLHAQIHAPIASVEAPSPPTFTQFHAPVEAPEVPRSVTEESTHTSRVEFTRPTHTSRTDSRESRTLPPIHAQNSRTDSRVNPTHTPVEDHVEVRDPDGYTKVRVSIQEGTFPLTAQGNISLDSIGRMAELNQKELPEMVQRLVTAGVIKVVGSGRATRYRPA